MGTCSCSHPNHIIENVIDCLDKTYITGVQYADFHCCDCKVSYRVHNRFGRTWKSAWVKLENCQHPFLNIQQNSITKWTSYLKWQPKKALATCTGCLLENIDVEMKTVREINNQNKISNVQKWVKKL